MKQATRPLHLLPTLLVIATMVSAGVTGFRVSASPTTTPESATPPSSAECVCGPRRVSLLLFDFQDAKHNMSDSPVTYTRIVSEMNASFYRQSYGKMWLVGGQVYGWYDSTLNLSDFKKTRGWVHFMPDDQGMKLLNVASSKAKSLGLSGYIMAVYAGPVWSWANYTISTSVQAESDGLEFFMHEFGHLIGLRDLRHELMQGWDLMDSNTTELSAWSRIQLGWLTADAVASINPAEPVSLTVLLIDVPKGIRAVQIPTSLLLGYYMIETRLKEGYGMCLLVYSVEDSSREGGTPGGFRTVLTTDPEWNRVVVRNEFAIIILEEQIDGIRIGVASREMGEKARFATEKLQSASASIQSALSSNRTQGLSDAQGELEKAWKAYRIADFDTAGSSAEKARKLADASTIPQAHNEFSNYTLILIVVVAVGLVVSVAFLLLRSRSSVTNRKTQ